jgi:hypothetical protein
MNPDTLDNLLISRGIIPDCGIFGGPSMIPRLIDHLQRRLAVVV